MSKSKLQNIKAIQNMLSGTHKSQTRHIHYYGKMSNDILEENIIERDDQGNPKVWIEATPNSSIRMRVTQHDGWKSRETEAGYLVRKTIKDLEMPAECPTCNKNMHGTEKRLNKKFWNQQKQCFDCVVKLETRLRNDPEAWDKYQREKMYKNAKSFFIDADADVVELEKMLTEKMTNVQNADGDLEQFEAAMSKTTFKDTILKQYKQYKKQILSELKTGKGKQV